MVNISDLKNSRNDSNEFLIKINIEAQFSQASIK